MANANITTRKMARLNEDKEIEMQRRALLAYFSDWYEIAFARLAGNCFGTEFMWQDIRSAIEMMSPNEIIQLYNYCKDKNFTAGPAKGHPMANANAVAPAAPSKVATKRTALLTYFDGWSADEFSGKISDCFNLPRLPREIKQTIKEMNQNGIDQFCNFIACTMIGSPGFAKLNAIIKEIESGNSRKKTPTGHCVDIWEKDM